METTPLPERCVGRTTNAAVVDADQVSVGGEPDVALQRVGALVERRDVGAQRVLGPRGARTAVGDHLRPTLDHDFIVHAGWPLAGRLDDAGSQRWLRRNLPKWGTVKATVPRSPENTRPFLIRPSRAGESDCGLRPSSSGDVGGADREVVGALAEVGHRDHVVALGRGGAVVAGAEEADGQLRLGLGRRLHDVGPGDRRLDRQVPGHLAVGLHEVGVAVGQAVELVERLRARRSRPRSPPGGSRRARPSRGAAGRPRRSGTAARRRTWTRPGRPAGAGGRRRRR